MALAFDPTSAYLCTHAVGSAVPTTDLERNPCVALTINPGGGLVSSENVRTAEGPDDPRQFVRIAIDLPFGTKTDTVSDPIAAIAAQVIAICAAAQSFTDGHVPVNKIRRAGITDTIIKEMIVEGFWHDEHSDISGCTRCQEPKPKFIYVHDYLRHQRSAAQVQNQRAKKSAAGAIGAQKRWAPLREKQESERVKQAAKAVKAGEQPETRSDVERLCNYLAGWIERNDSKHRRPPVGQAWLNDMRKMLDIDGFSVEDLRDVIEWTQKHEFWNEQIKSPFKLRKQMKPTGSDLYGKMRREKYGEKGKDIVYGRQRSDRPDAGQRASKAMDIAAQLDNEFGYGDDDGQKEITA
jgi:hypothetical protein